MLPNDYTRQFKGLTIRGDSLSCPLAFGLDTYYNCPYDCVYCLFLNLPKVWGAKDPWRALDLPWFISRITNGLKNTRPKSALAHAIQQRKTLRIGNRYDPLPPAERHLRVTQQVLEFLADMSWEVKLESKNAALLYEYTDILVEMNAIVTSTVLIGMDDDWLTLEPSVYSSPMARLAVLQHFAQQGLQVAVTTEPFIPGYHTPRQFEEFVALVRGMGINRLNVYPLQLNPHNAMRLLRIGLDVERVLAHSLDEVWRPVLEELLGIAQDAGVRAGCPDWVNAGRFRPTTNTCCGVDVKRSCTFNLVNWRAIGLEHGLLDWIDLHYSYDGVGDFEDGREHFTAAQEHHYSLADTGIFEWIEDRWVLV